MRWTWCTLLVACGSPAAAIDAAVSRDAAEDATSGFIVGGTIHEWTMPGPSGTPLDGVSVCVYRSTQCTTTDAGGNYVLHGVAAAGDWGITLELAGHLRTVILVRPLTADFTTFGAGIITTTIAQEKVVAAGGTWPLAGAGIAEVGVFAGATAMPAVGATATLAPAVGTGPAYLGTDGRPDLSLTATSSEGGVMFVDVPPGNATIGLAMPGKTCVTAQDGWRGAAASTLRLPVEADSLVYAAALCP